LIKHDSEKIVQQKPLLTPWNFPAPLSIGLETIAIQMQVHLTKVTGFSLLTLMGMPLKEEFK
jgi:hypothetical protein